VSIFLPIPLWIQWGQIAQFLRQDQQELDGAFINGSLNAKYARRLYIVTNSVAYQYSVNPNDPNLITTGQFLLSLIGFFQLKAQNIQNSLSATLPVFTGPNNQSVTVGSAATFSISITGGTTPITYQWYRNGVAIPGATGISYTLSNAQLTDSGSVFSVTANNSAGSVGSSSATLTVTQTITGNYCYTTTNPGPLLTTNQDTFTYEEEFNITHNQPLVVPLPSGSSPFQYSIIRVPSTESIKTTWVNDQFNSGTIGDTVFAPYVQFGGNTYYYTRNLQSFDTSSDLTLS
jgi:hypothetical protein